MFFFFFKTRNISITWGLIKNEESLPPLQTYCILAWSPGMFSMIFLVCLMKLIKQLGKENTH